MVEHSIGGRANNGSPCPRPTRAGLDRTGREQYDEFVMAVQCARVFTGQQFSEGLTTVLLDQEKIVGIQTGHADLNESWQVVEYPGGRLARAPQAQNPLRVVCGEASGNRCNPGEQSHDRDQE